MKKLSLLSALLLLLGLPVMAEEGEGISVGTDGTVEVKQGKTALMPVMFHLNENHDYVSYQFTVNLPEGISFVEGVDPVLGEGQEPASKWVLDLNTTSHIVTCYNKSNPVQPISLAEGVLVYIPIQAAETITIGDEVEGGSLSDVVFATSDAVSHSLSGSTFTVKILDPRTVLDENSTEAPVAEENANVLVKRTIKKDEWSTICLPFAMSAEQIATAFPENATVILKDFTGVETTTDADENITALKLNFSDAEAIEANHPYLIKISNVNENITEFGVENVTINPSEEQPSVDRNELKQKVGKVYVYFYNSFKGTYVSNTIVPEYCLFLSDNKFYYSTGLTNMKAFRGYFDFYDILAEVDNAEARIQLSFGDGETTDLHNIQVLGEDEGWYTISGQKLDKKPTTKGVYIHGGEKVIIKADRRK